MIFVAISATKVFPDPKLGTLDWSSHHTSFPSGDSWPKKRGSLGITASHNLGIQSPCQMMIGVYNHLLRKVFRFHYQSKKVIGSLGIDIQSYLLRLPRFGYILVIQIPSQQVFGCLGNDCAQTDLFWLSIGSMYHSCGQITIIPEGYALWNHLRNSQVTGNGRNKNCPGINNSPPQHEDLFETSCNLEWGVKPLIPGLTQPKDHEIEVDIFFPIYQHFCKSFAGLAELWGCCLSSRLAGTIDSHENKMMSIISHRIRMHHLFTMYLPLIHGKCGQIWRCFGIGFVSRKSYNMEIQNAFTCKRKAGWWLQPIWKTY